VVNSGRWYRGGCLMVILSMIRVLFVFLNHISEIALLIDYGTMPALQ
jgi:hypothetical protein